MVTGASSQPHFLLSSWKLGQHQEASSPGDFLSLSRLAGIQLSEQRQGPLSPPYFFQENHGFFVVSSARLHGVSPAEYPLHTFHAVWDQGG